MLMEHNKVTFTEQVFHSESIFVYPIATLSRQMYSSLLRHAWHAYYGLLLNNFYTDLTLWLQWHVYIGLMWPLPYILHPEDELV